MWQLTGAESRNLCAAGYKGLYQDGTYPSPAFLASLHPDFADFTTKLAPGRALSVPASRA